MDFHAIALMGYMVSTVLKLIIAFTIHVESTENAVIKKAGIPANVIVVGLETSVHPLIFALTHHVDNMVFVKIILITLLACVTKVLVDINAKSMIIV